MFNLENNKQTLEQGQLSKFESMSDAEFYSWCLEHYNVSEKQNNLPYKTIIFKQGGRGLYSDDLEKIVLLDKFSNDKIDEITPQTPYIVEVIRDTKPDQPRQGAILVKVIKPAELKDVYKNEETKTELSQLQFYQSDKNKDEVYSREAGKITLIDKKADLKVKPKETWIGRCENKGAINVFKPLLKASDWQDYSVEMSKNAKSFFIYKNTYHGLLKRRSDILHLNDENAQDILEKFNGFDKQILWENFSREKRKEAEQILKQQEYEQAIDQAKEWAWQEYSQNNVIIEKINDKNNNYYYKVKVGETWSDVDFKITTNKDEPLDWRKFVPEQACRLVINEQDFLDSLKKFENIDINFSNIEQLIPKKEFIYEKSKNLSEECVVFDNFRKINCEKVDLNLSYLRGQLVFEPRLICRFDVDSDYGLHKDDSSANKTYRLAYALQSEKINFTDEVNKLPEHINYQVKQIIENYINSLLKPRETILEVEVAGWIEDFNSKLEQIKKMDFSSRQKLISLETANSEQKQLLENRLIMTEKEFKDLQITLPVEKFAKINDDHSLNYFGLPFKRYQHYEKKQYKNSRFLVEQPLVGEYDVVFNKMTSQQLAFWLDSNQKYFNNLQSNLDINKLADKLPKLVNSVDEEIINRCRLLQIVKNNTGLNDFVYKLNSNYLDLTVNLTDDFSDLEIVVNNIDSGMYGSLEAVTDIYKFIVEHKWFVNQQILNIFKTKGINDDQLKVLSLKPVNIDFKADQTLPFKPYI